MASSDLAATSPPKVQHRIDVSSKIDHDEPEESAQPDLNGQKDYVRNRQHHGPKMSRFCCFHLRTNTIRIARLETQIHVRVQVT